MIEIEHLSFQYEDSPRPALNSIDLHIREGEFIAVLGANGSGKTTLARCLNGLLLPTGGDVRVDGRSVRNEENLWDIRRKVGMVFQNPDNQIVSTMVEREVAFGLENLGCSREEMHTRVEQALRRFDLLRYRRHPPHRLSGGEKQRLAIASVWAMQPKYIVFDEPTSLLDPKGRQEIGQWLRELNADRGETILHITQFPDEACWARRLIVLSEGRIVMDGTPTEVFRQKEQLDTLGLDVPFPTRVAHFLGLSKAILSEDALIEALESEKGAWTAGEPPVEPRREDPSGQTLLHTEALSYVYNRNLPTEQQALSEVTLQILEGSFAGLIGSTGSGKSTLVQHFNGLLRPSEGRVLLKGQDLWAKGYDRTRVRQKVGLVFQFPEFQLFEETVADDVAFGPRNLNWPANRVQESVTRALEMVGLDPEAFGGRPPMALSSGEKRRVAIAGVLAMDPEVLIFDEPTSGLDPRGGRQLIARLTALHEKGRTIVCISHDMDLIAETVQQVIALDRGQVVFDGPPEQVFLQTHVLRNMGLVPPQTVALALKLKARGWPFYAVPRTIEEWGSWALKKA